MNLSKEELRINYKRIRSCDVNTSETDKLIFDFLINSELYKEADTVFSYYSIGDEVETVEIIKHSLNDSKKVALPVCIDADGSMDFYLIDNLSDLCDGMYSIKEPNIDYCKPAPVTERSICLVPALAFDEKGYRLGYGKGYYDRFLENFKGISVGLCRSSCLCSELPRDPHDKKVNVLITENAIYKF